MCRAKCFTYHSQNIHTFSLQLKVVFPPVTSVDSKPSAPKKVKTMLPKHASPTAVDGVSVGLDGSVTLVLDVSLPPESYLTEGAPSAWQIFIPGELII